MWGTYYPMGQPNLWSDGQKLYIRLYMKAKLPFKMEPNSYTESGTVIMADGGRARSV